VPEVEGAARDHSRGSRPVVVGTLKEEGGFDSVGLLCQRNGVIVRCAEGSADKWARAVGEGRGRRAVSGDAGSAGAAVRAGWR